MRPPRWDAFTEEVVGSKGHWSRRPQPSAALADATAKQSAWPSVAGHYAVKTSYVDKLELLDPLCQDPSPSGRLLARTDELQKDGPHRLAPPPCLAMRYCVAPDGSAADFLLRATVRVIALEGSSGKSGG